MAILIARSLAPPCYTLDMNVPAVAITPEPLDLDALVRVVSEVGGHGAVVSFLGIVRNENL